MMSEQFKITYAQERGPEAIPFDRYLERVQTEYLALLDSCPKERALQDFLEKHPCMVPGAWTPGIRSGHAPYYNAVITQPQLPGFTKRIPDFLWLSNHSGCIYAALVEIERPEKKLFTAQGQPTADFTQARTQLHEWRMWFEASQNRQIFLDHYGITTRDLWARSFDLHLILVYGRRAEFENFPELSRKRAHLIRDKNEELISLDRLSPDLRLRDAVTLTADGNATFRVKYVPETFGTSPCNAPYLLHYNNLKDAIASNLEIPDARREFLIRRVDYWIDWAKSGSLMRGGGSFIE